MMSKGFRPLFLLMGLFFLAGCAGKIPHMLAADYAEKKPRLIAVMPVRNLAADAGTASVLRERFDC